ncbi:Uncharacterised protein [Mycobacteroides abscessus subsp. abscessus]|nr:Uncharacterised protein [Mycobacteroides abscessus subsp. abscessus]
MPAAGGKTEAVLATPEQAAGLHADQRRAGGNQNPGPHSLQAQQSPVGRVGHLRAEGSTSSTSLAPHRRGSTKGTPHHPR